ncbi:(4Fe-4S)-binding protein, partial [Candidatus Fermentibacteria bacterium]
MVKTLMLCNCGNSQTLDADAIGEATDLKCSIVHNSLCTSGLDTLTQVLPDGDLIIACAQEAGIFEELAAELDTNIPQCIDIRDRAGWSDEGKTATPKIVALLAEASLPVPVVKTFDVESEGLCLIIGPSDIALPVAEQLSDVIDVTAVLTDTPEIIPSGLDVLSGHIRSASGTLGRFEVSVDGLRTLEPSGRGVRKFTAPRDGGKSECDIILDLTGNTPLFSAYEKRDGYLRADPKDPLAVARAVYDAAQMQGTFEKPFYVAYEEHLCAHSRATKSGCNRCLDVCPTGAITSNGDSVSIDPNICAGCGECAAVCPSGAVAYDAPPVQFLFTRIRTLASTYLNAGG